jgi:glycosyltransferase involved in cell wall biosynthesis
MKILIITPHLNIGGVPRYVLNLSTGLKRAGHSVMVASAGGVWERELAVCDVPLIKVPLDTKSILSPKLLRAAIQLREFVRTKEIDIVHANTRVGQMTAFLLQRLSGVSYVSTYHGYYRAHALRRLFPLTGARAIAISEEIRRHAVQDLGVAADAISTVYNGIDVSNSTPMIGQEQARKELSIAGDPVIGIVARLSTEKNHELLFAAFALLLARYQKARLVVFGQGRCETRLRERVGDMGIASSVTFITSGDLDAVYASLDLAVLPSRQEGFGLTIIEAQWRGVPVVGSPAGGIAEVIENDVTGFVLNDFDETELCDKITLLLEDRILRERFVAAARLRISERFSLETMAAGTCQVYMQALKKGNDAG